MNAEVTTYVLALSEELSGRSTKEVSFSNLNLGLFIFGGLDQTSRPGNRRRNPSGKLYSTMPLHDFLTLLPQHLASYPIRTLVALPPLLLLAYILVNEVARYRARVPGMRGPPGLPLIGNLASIQTNATATYKDWARTYGDVYQVQMGNVPVVVVNSARAARALWVGQSQALSSRPVTYTFHKVSGSSSLLLGGLKGGGGTMLV